MPAVKFLPRLSLEEKISLLDGHEIMTEKPGMKMPYTIALVEDDETLRNNYAQALMRDGYQVTSYDSRQEASTAFSNTLPNNPHPTSERT